MIDLRPPWCCAGMVRESERTGPAMSEASQPLNALPQGHRLQERVLGFGGFGMTYLGFDHNLDLSPPWQSEERLWPLS